MAKGSFAAVGFGALAVVFAACGVDPIDMSQKTCPCPDGFTCDPATNHCLAPGTVSPATLDAGVSCAPKSCDEMHIECGPTDDGCKQFLDCGPCPIAGNACVDNKCVCVGQTCASLGAQCGTIPTGCGADELICQDQCTPAKPNCGGAGPNRCGTGTCTPKTCQSGVDCGKISDTCGAIIDCGGCFGSSSSCGGGGVLNKCGCTSKTCAQIGWACGTGRDNCGKNIDCGNCPSGKFCSSSHACTSCPATCATLGWQCGSGSDGCGGTANCGNCSFGSCSQSHHCDD